MKTVVVTGSTRGIGRGLAENFLARDCRVVISGRSQPSVDAVVAELGDRHGADKVAGLACEISDGKQLQALWDTAAQRFARVDVWINNAGTSNVQRPFAELEPASLRQVVESNLIGTLNGCRAALAGMKAQGHGHLFTMEGYGSDGSVQPGMSVYGATKSAIRYLTRALVEETRGGPVKVGRLSPGVVVTDLLLDVYRDGDPANWRRQRWLFKFIADPVEEVAPWLADRVLAGPRHGEFVAWMTVLKAALRFFQPYYHRRDLFADQQLPG